MSDRRTGRTDGNEEEKSLASDHPETNCQPLFDRTSGRKEEGRSFTVESGGARLKTGFCMLATAVASLLLSYPASATGINPCDKVDTHITEARKHEYSMLVPSGLTTPVRPSSVQVHNILSEGTWSAVYASTPATEPAFFFFDAVDGQKRFRDIWAGFAVPEERSELIEWAKNLGAPEHLATCFAHTVVD